MIYSETPERASEVAEQAFAHIQDHNLPPNPQNYAIWYEYCSGRNPSLVRFIDRACASGLKITPASCREIYDRFFTTTNADREGWSNRIQEAANQIMEALEHAGKDAEHYEEALQTFSGNLETATDHGDLSTAVKGILEETRAMDNQIRTLQAKVEDSHDEVADLREQLAATRREAMTDTLTGLANRKCFDDALVRMTLEARADSEPLSLVLCDIDHFKQFNDNFGHPIGDQVLRLVGLTLNEGTKGSDLAARYGGEEFALILPKTPLGGAQTVAENLRRTIASRRLARKGSTKSFGAITMSFGATEYLFGEPLEAFVARADKLLYRAKSEGRNRVCGSIESGGPPLKQAV